MKLRAPKGEGALALDELDGHVGGLVALAGRAVLNGAALRRRRPRRSHRRHVRRAATSASSCSAICCATKKPTTTRCVDLASAFHVPVIATNGVRFAEPADRPLYDVLTCIRHKTTLERAGPAADAATPSAI